jgi:hypothetical protein
MMASRYLEGIFSLPLLSSDNDDSPLYTLEIPPEILVLSFAAFFVRKQPEIAKKTAKADVEMHKSPHFNPFAPL